MLERKVLYIKKDEVDEVVVKELLSVMVSYGIERSRVTFKNARTTSKNVPSRDRIFRKY